MGIRKAHVRIRNASRTLGILKWVLDCFGIRNTRMGISNACCGIKKLIGGIRNSCWGIMKLTWALECFLALGNTHMGIRIVFLTLGIFMLVFVVLD